MLLLKLLLALILNGLHSTSSNLLCETDRWNEIDGNWIYNSTTCGLHSVASDDVSVIWFGDRNGSTPDAALSSLTSFVLSVDILMESGEGGGGIIFRAQNANSHLYWLLLVPKRDQIIIQEIGDNLFDTKKQEYSTTLEYNTSYNLLIESMVNDITKYNIYLNNSLLFNVSLTNLTDGSIGFRVRKTPTFYYNLTYSGIPSVNLPLPNTTNVAASLVV